MTVTHLGMRRMFRGATILSMRKPSNLRFWCLTAGCLLFVTSNSAYAYLDPGTGSILIQSLLAGVAVAIGVVRAYWYRIKSFFVAKPQSSSDSLGNADDSTQDSSSGG